MYKRQQIGDKIVVDRGPMIPPRILYAVLGREAKAARGWDWRLSFWVHGDPGGDDVEMVVKIRGERPTEDEIFGLIKRTYVRRGADLEVFENMKGDHHLIAIR